MLTHYVRCALGGNWLLRSQVLCCFEDSTKQSLSIPARKQINLLSLEPTHLVRVSSAGKILKPTASVQVSRVLTFASQRLRAHAQPLQFPHACKAVYMLSSTIALLMCPRRELNPHHKLRRPAFYPLNYEDMLLSGRFCNPTRPFSLFQIDFGSLHYESLPTLLICGLRV